MKGYALNFLQNLKILAHSVVAILGNDSDEPRNRNVVDFGELLCHHPTDRLSVILKI